MSMFSGMNINASALTAARLRMDTISANIANAETTRGEFVDGVWKPYRRKMVEVTPQGTTKFDNFLEVAMHNSGATKTPEGVKVSRIVADQTPFKRVYQPEHVDADAEGFVYLPNVDPLKEMVDLMSVQKTYESNIAAFNASKAMMLKTLEIGR